MPRAGQAGRHPVRLDEVFGLNPLRFLDIHHAVAAVSYTALVLLQPLWHAILPEPLGSGSWWLGAIAPIPLLFPIRGIWKGSLRSMTWGGYLLMLYLAIGVMEAWSNPPQRLPALLQTALVVICFYAIFQFSRRPT